MESDKDFQIFVGAIDFAINYAKTKLNEDNIFYNEKYVDYIIASKLNLKINEGTQGFDAFTVEGEPIEIKSSNKNRNGKFSSFQFHWLSYTKLKKYKETKYIYFVLRDGTHIINAIRVLMEDFYPKIEKKAMDDGTALAEEIKTNSHFSMSFSKIIKEFKYEVLI